MVGYNFKSNINFYNSGNFNEKIKQKFHISHILELVVKA